MEMTCKYLFGEGDVRALLLLHQRKIQVYNRLYESDTLQHVL
jgi:hypothetical protein